MPSEHRNLWQSLISKAQFGITSNLEQAGFYPRLGKRIFDLIGAAMLLFGFSPIFLVISMIVMLERGSIFFAHQRNGQRGVAFPCLKFRTMLPHAEERLKTLVALDPIARREWERNRKLSNDQQITVLGSFLRRSGLDELPQLLNVLAGHMSLVGPRPATVSELARYGNDVQNYLAVRPGMTGLWQVSGYNQVSYDRRVALDSHYVDNLSFRQDLIILARTVKVVLYGEGK